MKLIVGLGNPEMQYAQTRHNAGFLCLDAIAQKFEFPAFELEKKFFGETSYGHISHTKVILLKPHTWMNLSGKSVSALLHFYKIKTEDISIISDDADLDFGIIRFREKGSAGGHNGIRSIIKMLGTENFSRIKIGISTPLRKKIPTDNFVLQKFTEEEQAQLPKIFEHAIEKLIKHISINHYV
ncbi:aminoacyl-tRNA hydrolase [Candidatus Gracilibacteria bacterium]|nr:aminoacyl-tRNA hydrolase [Candidatus Gracilibacteria bacterium]